MINESAGGTVDEKNVYQYHKRFMAPNTLDDVVDGFVILPPGSSPHSLSPVTPSSNLLLVHTNNNNNSSMDDGDDDDDMKHDADDLSRKTEDNSTDNHHLNNNHHLNKNDDDDNGDTCQPILSEIRGGEQENAIEPAEVFSKYRFLYCKADDLSPKDIEELLQEYRTLASKEITRHLEEASFTCKVCKNKSPI
jgi:hypothetical protein